MAVVVGLDGYLYRNTGTEATPVWTLFDCIRDVTGSISANAIDVSSRKSKKRLNEPGLEDWSIEAEANYDPADANVAAIVSAITGRTEVDLLALDNTSATSGAEGPRIIGHVYDASRTEPLEDAMRLPFVVRPGSSATTPASWHTVP